MAQKPWFLPPGGKAFMLANHAIARAVLESDVKVAAFYPGSPTTEILDTLEGVADLRDDLVMEISANEKVAFETAAGASFAGVRSFTSMKSVGLNVASDSYFSVGYTGVNGGMVLLIADDPFCHSSQSEQDGRTYAEAAHVPMLEPDSAQEAYEMVKWAFDLSERHRMLVLVRTTTRVNHQSAVVEFKDLDRTPLEKLSWKDVGRTFYTLSATARALKAEKLGKLKEVEGEFESAPFNHLEPGQDDLGILASGVSIQYVREAVELLGIRPTILKLGTTYPLPRKLLGGLLGSVSRVVVVEELLPYLETRVRALAKDLRPEVEIIGKENGPFEKVGEYNVMTVTRALAGITGSDSGFDFEKPLVEVENLRTDLPYRPPTFCPGCPHRGTLWALQKAIHGRDVVLNNDIGCYSMLLLPPHERTDSLLSMGASLGLNAGMQHVLEDQVVSLCGDSTFFHAALPGLANAARHNHDFTMIIVKNDVTAMTGQQAHPASGFGPRRAQELDIETVVRGMGIEKVLSMSAFDPQGGVEILKEALDHEGVSVVVSYGPCALYGDRKKRRAREDIVPRRVVPDKCKTIYACIREFACPAIELDEKTGQARIRETLCNGCGNCARLCPAQAIESTGGDE